ncbi:hypothetical protein ACFL3C_04930 [Patescibacteria group bacterium]
MSDRAERKLITTLPGTDVPIKSSDPDSGFFPKVEPGAIDGLDLFGDGTIHTDVPGRPGVDFIASEIFEQTGQVTQPGVEMPMTGVGFLKEARMISGDRKKVRTVEESRSAIAGIANSFIRHFGNEKLKIDHQNCDEIFLEILSDLGPHTHSPYLRRTLAMQLYSMHMKFNGLKQFDLESLEYINKIINALFHTLSFGLELPDELKRSFNDLQEQPDAEVAPEESIEEDKVESIGSIRRVARAFFVKLGISKEDPPKVEEKTPIPEPPSKTMINFELLEIPESATEVINAEMGNITRLHDRLRELQSKLLQSLMVAVSEIEVRFSIREQTRNTDIWGDFVLFCRNMKEKMSDDGTKIREEGEAIYARVKTHTSEDLAEEVDEYFAHLLNPWDEIFMPQLVHYARIAFGDKPERPTGKPDHLPEELNEAMTYHLQGRYAHLTGGLNCRTIPPKENLK